MVWVDKRGSGSPPGRKEGLVLVAVRIIRYLWDWEGRGRGLTFSDSVDHSFVETYVLGVWT